MDGMIARRERPILFSAPMIRATLEGRKSQTRRIVKGAPCGKESYLLGIHHPTAMWGIHADVEHSDGVWRGKCPYGKPGDRLWVREAWQYSDWTDDGYPWITYRADGARALHESIPEDWSERLLDTWECLSKPDNYDIDQRAADRHWRPGIHMPRWASRILLEVTDVRVQRLCDISEADCWAEGIEPSTESPSQASTIFIDYASPRRAYNLLWESINGSDSWDANPWVWAITFRRIEAEERAE